LPIEQVHGEKQHPGEQTVATPRRGEGLGLSGDKLVVVKVQRTPRNIGLVSQLVAPRRSSRNDSSVGRRGIPVFGSLGRRFVVGDAAS
jgi:hypothetical protein